MDLNKFSLGAKKNVKKEINVDVTYKHIIGFFFFLILLVMFIMILLTKFNIGIEEMKLECRNGTFETITHGQEFYCGQHYSILNGTISESGYKNMENLIKNGK